MFLRKIKFQVGDLVRHEPSNQQGVAVEVKGNYVKFRVLEKTNPDGTPYIAQFNANKVTLLATRAQVLAWVMEKQAEQRKKMSIGARFFGWLKRKASATARVK